jgi:hypothetical protein
MRFNVLITSWSLYNKSYDIWAFIILDRIEVIIKRRIHLSFVIVYSSLHPSSTKAKTRNTIILVDNMYVLGIFFPPGDSTKTRASDRRGLIFRPMRKYRRTFYCKSAGYMHKL